MPGERLPRGARQLAAAAEPVGRILRHAPRDHGIHRRRDRRLRARAGDRGREVLLEHGAEAVAAVRGVPGERLEQDARQRVHVARDGGRVTVEPLGRRVRLRADEQSRRRHPGLRIGDREPEVEQVREPRLGEFDVGGLDVPVHEALGVRRVERAGHLLDEGDGAVRRQRTVVQDLREIAALDQAHVDEQHPVDLAEVVDGDDVRVREARHRLRFAGEALAELRILRGRCVQQLQRDVPIALRVGREVDLAHAAAAEQAADLVRPQRAPAARALAHGRPLPLRAALIVAGSTDRNGRDEPDSGDGNARVTSERMTPGRRGSRALRACAR